MHRYVRSWRVAFCYCDTFFENVAESNLLCEALDVLFSFENLNEEKFELPLVDKVRYHTPMKPLNQQKCVPCEGGVDPMTRKEFAVYLEMIDSNWKVIEKDTVLQREFEFKDFAANLKFVNRVGAIAEKEGHHPDMNIHGWNKLTITLSTHAIKGLSINDFVLASKVDQLLKK